MEKIAITLLDMETDRTFKITYSYCDSFKLLSTSEIVLDGKKITVDRDLCIIHVDYV